MRQNRILRNSSSHNQQRDQVWPWKKKKKRKKNSSTVFEKVTIFPGHTQTLRSAKTAHILQSATRKIIKKPFSMITLAQKLWFRWSWCVLGVINTDFAAVSLTHSHFNKVLEPKASYNASALEAASLRKPLVLLSELIFELLRAIFECTTELLNYISPYFNGNVHMRQIRPMKETWTETYSFEACFSRKFR